MVAHGRGAVLELAHALVDQAEEVLEVVGRGGVGGEARVARGLPALDGDALGAGLVLRLGDGDQLGEDFDLLRRGGLAAVEDVEGLLEVEEPERQAEVLGADDVGAAAEGGAVLVVDVEEEDAELGAHVDHLAEDRGDGARLADAGGADDGEVLGEQVVGVDVGGDRGVLAEVADGDRAGAASRRR